MKTIIPIVCLLCLSGCGTRQFSLQKANGNEVGSVSVYRGLQTDEISIVETNKPPRLFICDWKSTLSGTKCFEVQ